MKYELREVHETSHWGGSDSCNYNEHYYVSFYGTFKEAEKAFNKIKDNNPFRAQINSSNLTALYIYRMEDSSEEYDKLLKSWELP